MRTLNIMAKTDENARMNATPIATVAAGGFGAELTKAIPATAAMITVTNVTTEGTTFRAWRERTATTTRIMERMPRT